MNWFDPSDEVVIDPTIDAPRFWQRTFNTDTLYVSSDLLYANNGYGRLFERVCQSLDHQAEVTYDNRARGILTYRTAPGSAITVCRAPTPAPWAAQNLEGLIAAGARRIVFLNGAGALTPDLAVGSVVLPRVLVREEGTSFHYAAADVVLRTADTLRARLLTVATALGIAAVEGDHWTTDALYRETRGKVARLRAVGVNSVDMELSALAGVTHFRHCELAAVHVVTDVLTEHHSWSGVDSSAFDAGAERVADLAAAFATARYTL